MALDDRARGSSLWRVEWPQPDAGDDLGVLVDMLGSIGQYGGAYLPYWRRQLTIVLDGLRARPDLTPLPGAGQSFDAFHDMSHAKAPR